MTKPDCDKVGCKRAGKFVIFFALRSEVPKLKRYVKQQFWACDSHAQEIVKGLNGIKVELKRKSPDIRLMIIDLNLHPRGLEALGLRVYDPEEISSHRIIRLRGPN